MATEDSHLCMVTTQSDIHLNILKKIIKGRKRADDLFKCGSCNATFETICVLHAHCMKHVDGGSYHFDSYTCTAFPKYDTACTYTQYDPTDFEGRDEVTETSVELNLDEDMAARRGKRKRKPCNASKSKLKAKKRKLKKQIPACEDAEETIHADNVYSVCKLKIDGTETEDVIENISDTSDEKVNDSQHMEELTDIVDEDTSESCINGHMLTSDEIDLPQDEKIVNEDEKRVNKERQEDSPCSFEAKDNDNNPLDEEHSESLVLDHNDKNQHTGNDIKDKAETEEDVSQKNDELTATEALLEIGIGNQNFSDCGNERRSSGRLIRKVNKRSNHMSKGAVKNVKEEVEEECSNHAQTDADFDLQPWKGIIVKEENSAGIIKKYECPVCGKIGSASMITYHKYLHSEKPTPCNICGIKFHHPTTLKKHLLQHEVKQFKCDQCPAAFHRRQYLVTHMMSHSGERPYMCDTCGKAYRDVNNLNRHVRHVHEQLRNFECDICGEKFFRIDHMKNHRIRHFDANMKCEFCGKSFKHPTDLNRHMKLHTGDKPYLCTVCRHGFITVSPYYTHMLKKHNIDREEAKSLHEKHKQHSKDGTLDILLQPRKVIIKIDKSGKEVKPGKDSTVGGKSNANMKALNRTGKQTYKKDKKNKIKAEKLPNYEDTSVESFVDDVGNSLFLEGQYQGQLMQTTKASSTDLMVQIINSATSESNILNQTSYSGGLANDDSKLVYQTVDGELKTFEFMQQTTCEQELVTTGSPHLPVQGVFSEEVHDGTEEVGGVNLMEFVESEHGIGASVGHLQDGQIVVLGEDGGDLGILSQFDGDNAHAVIVGDYEYADEVVIDQC